MLEDMFNMPVYVAGSGLLVRPSIVD